MKNWKSKAVSIFTSMILAFAFVFTIVGTPEQRVYAQFVGAAYPPGFAAAANNGVVNAAIGNNLATTNPASNFIVLVQGGPVYCGGSEQIVGTSTLTLQANTTYLLVWNCSSELLYAKTAVNGPGSSGTTPGVPASYLAAIPNVEVPLSTVVCNATACGNGGNGSITDARPLSAFPGGGMALATSTFANLPTSNVPDGTMILCTNCTQPTSGSAACSSAAASVLAVRVAGAWRCY